MKAALAALALILALPAPAAASANPVTPPADVWSMQSDADYAPQQTRWRYVPPKPVRGFAAHGVFGHPEGAPGFDYVAAATVCGKAVPTDFYKVPSPAGQEFWFYQTEGQALLLVKVRSVTRLQDCAPVFQTTMQLYRYRFEKRHIDLAQLGSDGRYTVKTRFGAERAHDLGEFFSGWGGLPQLLLRRHDQLDQGGKPGKFGNTLQSCAVWSIAPDAGGGRCWIVGDGPARGFIVSEHEIMIGQPNYRFDVLDLQDSVPIDARLFEWDRRIELKAGS